VTNKFPTDPTNAHQVAGPPEAEPVVQAETRGHDPAEQVQPPEADAQDLYGPPSGQ
jgi:hypothetical protein